MSNNPYKDLIGLGLDQPERYIPSSIYLQESVSVSVSTIAEALGVSKKQVINSVLRIGLADYVKALRDGRPDLAEEDGAWSFLSPAEVLQAKDKFGDALQFDLVEEAEREAS